jgi:hypothetical protein
MMFPQQAFVRQEDLPHLEKIVDSLEKKGWGVRIAGEAELSDKYNVLELLMYHGLLFVDTNINDIEEIAKGLSEYKFKLNEHQIFPNGVPMYQLAIYGKRYSEKLEGKAIYALAAYDVKTANTTLRIVFSHVSDSSNDDEFLGDLHGVSSWELRLEVVGLIIHKNPCVGGGNTAFIKGAIPSNKVHQKGVNILSIDPSILGSKLYKQHLEGGLII